MSKQHDKLENDTTSGEIIDSNDKVAAGIDETVSTISHSPEEERKLIRKIDWRLIPIISALQVMSQYELAVITNAKLGGLLEDLSMSDSQYRWCLTVFYLGLIFFEVPSNIILRRWRPSLYIGSLVFSWGAIIMATSAATSFSGLLVSRLLLGVMEAGYIPGIGYYISMWYTRQENAQRSGFPSTLGCLAGASGGLIAYGISQISTHRLNTWQWMFLIEGAPCILLAFICILFLDDKPETAKFLNEKERALEITRLSLDQGAANDQTWSWDQVATVFTDWKTYMYFIIFLMSSISGVGVTLALPSIISGMGAWSRDVSLALTTPPYIIACVFTFIGCWSSDKLFERGYHIIVGSLIRILGMLMLMFVPHEQHGVRYFAVCIAVAPIYMVLSIKSAWFNNNFSGLTRRAVAVAFISGFGSVGSAVSSQVYFDPPNYFYGNLIGVVTLVVQTIFVFMLRFMLNHSNKKRAKMTLEEREQQVLKHGGPRMVGDRHPDFRYAL